MSTMKSPEELSVRDNEKKDKIAAEEEVEELLPGWKMEVKLRKGSSSKVDRYYTDPVTGYIFRSLKDAQRYLKTGEVGRLAIKPKDNEDGIQVPENASSPCKEMAEASDVNLQMIVSSPSSETSRRKRPLENGSQGYRTRSKSSETSKPELPQRASKRLAGIAPVTSPPEPKTRHGADIKIDAPSPEPKAHQATRKAGPLPTSPEPKTRQATRLAGIIIDASPPLLPAPKTRQATRLAGTEVDALTPSPAEPKTRAQDSSPLEPKTRQARRLAGMEVGASLPEPRTRRATRLAGMEIVPETKTCLSTRLAGNEVDSPPLSPPEPRTTREATRLSGIKTDSPPEPRTTRQATARRAREAETRTCVNWPTPKENDKKIEEQNSTSRGMQVECVKKITYKQDGNDDMDNKPNCKQETSILLPTGSPESREKINKDNLKSDEKQEFVFPPLTPSISLQPVSYTIPDQQAPPAVVPPLNSGTQTDNKHHGKKELPPVSHSIPQDSHGGETSMNFSLNDLWTDPCIEFAVKTLTGAIPFGETNKADNFSAAPIEVPLEELWADPCIEFAVKTLTGAIPIGEDPSVNDYLRHQTTSSSDVGVKFCQTEVLSKHFETQHNKQQDSAVPMAGNGGLLKSGNIVVPQQVNGSNGQCSRPRFFG